MTKFCGNVALGRIIALIAVLSDIHPLLYRAFLVSIAVAPWRLSGKGLCCMELVGLCNAGKYETVSGARQIVQKKNGSFPSPNEPLLHNRLRQMSVPTDNGHSLAVVAGFPIA
ncbi:MAG: hypothetical protein ACI9NT_000098 [Bacteroidia bacterium]|jgi:hypothetical protein